MEKYIIYCNEAQTKKALELGAPISVLPLVAGYYGVPHVEERGNDGKYITYLIPTAEQMIGFLRTKGIKFHFDDGTMYWKVTKKSRLISYGWSEEQKELRAIDAALTYLENNRK